MAGGTRLEHLELLRNDDEYLDALGGPADSRSDDGGRLLPQVRRRPHRRAAGVFNDTRAQVWRQQPEDFFREAILDADGTMVETTGQCKEGMDVNYKNQRGCHPLVLSLANTGEPLSVVNRPGGRPSHEQAPATFDTAIGLCRRAGIG